MNNPRISSRNLTKAALVLGIGGMLASVVAPKGAAAQQSTGPSSIAQSFLDPTAIHDGESLVDLDAAAPQAAASIGSAHKIGDTWFKLVDQFSEQCGAGTLRIETGSDNHWTSITRANVTFVTPFNNPNDAYGGRFDWKCGGSLEHSECSDSPNGPDKVRVFWSNDSREIRMRCFERCGDGSSASDC